MTARDVKYAIERGFYGTINNGYAETYFGALVGARTGVRPGTPIRGLKVPDDRTLVFHLSRPTGGILAAGALALPLTAPVPEEYARALDARNPSLYGHHRVATGPYMIANDAKGKAVGYDPGRRIRLVRNPSWDRRTDYKPAYLDEIESQTGNQETSIAALRVLEGKALVAGDFHPPPAVLKRPVRSGPRS